MRNRRNTSDRPGARAAVTTLGALGLSLLAACGTTVTREPTIQRDASVNRPATPAQPGRGGFYLDDGPGENPPPNLDAVPDAVPRHEPLHRGAARPYVVMGRNYTPMTSLQPYKARGVATWYGRRYHGKQTSSGEPYDMYGMTAAHTTLPIPSYVRVTNVANGRTVVVRVNDRGPFLNDRLIDLSYTAAYKLGVLAGGSAVVEVESVPPGTTVAAAPARARPSVQAAVAPSAVAPPTPPVSVAAAPVREAGEIITASLPATNPTPTPLSNSPPAKSTAGGVFLQLGAFGSRDNAESYLGRVKAQIDWLSDRVQLVQRDGLFRVHAGPFAQETEARSIAARLRDTLGSAPVLVAR